MPSSAWKKKPSCGRPNASRTPGYRCCPVFLQDTRPSCCRHNRKSALPSPYKSFPFCFFFNDTATTEIYTLSLHDALPICALARRRAQARRLRLRLDRGERPVRSEEHTSELQSLTNLVCRLLLEKKKPLGQGSRYSCARLPKVSFIVSSHVLRTSSPFF